MYGPVALDGQGGLTAQQQASAAALVVAASPAEADCKNYDDLIAIAHRYLSAQHGKSNLMPH